MIIMIPYSVYKYSLNIVLKKIQESLSSFKAYEELISAAIR